ncbi:proton extrusion protein PcxA [[Phormidium ambiguum] IAM M-71]|uniref:Proton extrusion protein PxcA n=1 Tax=[Phormidium ambiguum] IAM M-71 TaxID=454136 RepID=A0A1U7I6Y6_9CYAN|nr:proton extrusion protein PcxA [Phormidium ambiguum]OKH32129.1 proton extrusion protein PcxA [Phormidium ambiguum IAM M-71]
MINSIFTSIEGLVRSVKDWYFDTPERALEQAYNAALQIKAIEDEYFEGNKISINQADYSDSVKAYFRSELRQNLTIANNRLREFKASSSFLNLINSQKNVKSPGSSVDNNGKNYPRTSNSQQVTVTLEKLKFIDQITAKYKPKNPINAKSTSTSLVVVPQNNTKLDLSEINGLNNENELLGRPQNETNEFETVIDKTGVLPRSIFSTLNKIQRELDPESEQEVIKKYRTSKAKTIISLRFILTLIIVPLLTFQLFKIVVAGPIVNNLVERNKISLFINRDLEEEALTELRNYEQRLKFDYLISGTPKLSPETMEERLQERANEIAEESRRTSANAVKNVFSDLAAIAMFVVVLMLSRREIAILKSFMDEVVYGLSDSAKAFIIILLTDIFVGYHSPHGWEVLLENLARHLGLPESRDFIFLFIATFPVILDTVFKYWIFRYLNRISPSAVATYRNMNE